MNSEPSHHLVVSALELMALGITVKLMANDNLLLGLLGYVGYRYAKYLNDIDHETA